MGSKEPVVLVVLVEAENRRWFVAAVGLDGNSSRLVRSEMGDLDPYIGLDFDEQVSFLRHRFCGVLQRGCNRAWEQQKKPCQFVFVFEDLLGHAQAGDLTQRVAEHFVQWMANPPVVVFVSENGFRPGGAIKLNKLAGDLEPGLQELVDSQLGGLIAAAADAGGWEVAPKKAC